jgi:hypothetical protein
MKEACRGNVTKNLNLRCKMKNEIARKCLETFSIGERIED